MDEVNKVGITLTNVSDTDTDNGPGFKVALKATLPTDSSFEDRRAWVQSIFVSCITSTDQLVLGKNLIGNKVIFPEDLNSLPASGTDYLVFEQVINLNQLFGPEFFDEEFFVQVAARHLHSSPVLVGKTE